MVRVTTGASTLRSQRPEPEQSQRERGECVIVSFTPWAARRFPSGVRAIAWMAKGASAFCTNSSVCRPR